MYNSLFSIFLCIHDEIFEAQKNIVIFLQEIDTYFVI